MLDNAKLARFVDQAWGDSIVPTLVEYIKIPNKSPSFDPDWAAHGYMEEAVRLFEGWARERIAGLPGATLEIVRLPGRTPLMLIEVPGNSETPAHFHRVPQYQVFVHGSGKLGRRQQTSRQHRNPCPRRQVRVRRRCGGHALSDR